MTSIAYPEGTHRADMAPLDALRECYDLWASGAWDDRNAVYDLAETMEYVNRLLIADRLKYLRGELRAERISYGELAELQDLAKHIDPGDTELLEAAGVPEFPEAPSDDPYCAAHGNRFDPEIGCASCMTGEYR